MSYYISNVATNVFPIGNIMDRGFMVCTLAGSFFTSLGLTNDHLVPVSNMANTANPWV